MPLQTPMKLTSIIWYCISRWISHSTLLCTPQRTACSNCTFCIYLMEDSIVSKKMSRLMPTIQASRWRDQTLAPFINLSDQKISTVNSLRKPVINTLKGPARDLLVCENGENWANGVACWGGACNDKITMHLMSFYFLFFYYMNLTHYNKHH